MKRGAGSAWTGTSAVCWAVVCLLLVCHEVGLGQENSKRGYRDADLPPGVTRIPQRPKPEKPAQSPKAAKADASQPASDQAQKSEPVSPGPDPQGERNAQDPVEPQQAEMPAVLDKKTVSTDRTVNPVQAASTQTDDQPAALPEAQVNDPVRESVPITVSSAATAASEPEPGTTSPPVTEERKPGKNASALPPGVTPIPASPYGAAKKDQPNPGSEALEAMRKADEGILRPGSEPRKGGGLEGSLTVRPDARTMTLSIPAPRGQITDRNGKPFAQSKVVWYPALMFGQFEKAEKAQVIAWARKRIAQANELFGIEWNISDDQLWHHYRHRRWLAMPVTHVVDEKKKKEVEKSLMSGLILHPVYLRSYPEKHAAAHIIGYVGSSGKLEKGPINYGDPIFEYSEGRAGLEKIFDDVLKGKPGLLRKDYEADGTEVVKMFERRPKPGGTVVTTLDLDWQKYAEEVLEKYCSRGAFVVIDIQTGEVMTMASRPSFDLNDFMPYISNDKYQELREDPGTPLFGRAFQGGYPPASTFKPVVALAALNNREVSERSLIHCPPAIRIGKHWFRNWTKVPEGDIDVKRAIARSCNTWFYQVGIKTGPTAFLSLARKLGYGSKSGLPLVGETPGLIPTNEWMKKHHKRRMMDGDTANLSIGQGVMLASPLQVAQGMAGIANGGELPKLWLVKQIQDVGGRVLVANEPKRRNFLNLDPTAVDAVQEGMMQVVNAGYGTGQRAGLSYTVLCGKTGTAQWGPKSQNKRLAWFAGYFPYENPRFAFAALYEGKPNEKLSGGRKAAPMVNAFFEHFKKDIQIIIAPPPKALVIEEEDDEGQFLDIEGAPRAVPVEEEDDGGLDPAMGLPGAGYRSDGLVPEQTPLRPLVPSPVVPVNPVPRDPWVRPDGRAPSRAVPVEEDPLPAPGPRAFPGPDRSNRAIPVDET
ncbi:hypothetical protein HW115_02715 [Verrucomicrobiaceae bacterium N1E253]|uniref:beta-lactamase n=1 Tax=Oceaniferula marina TaxID=2748318 RepID=A0A851GHA4_9BACT|nr:penicillin-binding transpeptidase domain-containing protein [Oceaniferula marina]NWK54507.1 hypothetical protein [Oceaniferula marina]